MAFQPVPRGVEVAIHCSQNGVPVTNVIHVDAGASVTSTILNEIADIVGTWVEAHMLAECHNSLQAVDVTVTDLSTEDGEQVVQGFPPGTAGALTGDAAAANAAVVTSFRTGRIGRSYRGRFYLGGLATSGFANAQNVSTSYATGISSQFPVLIDTLLDAGYKLCVLSRWLNKVLRVVGVLTEVISVVTDTKVDSQRRRTAN